MLKILIAEDEEPIANLIRMNLAKAGYACTCAFDGEEAADLMEGGRYDLLLLDIMLPKIGGYELMEYARTLELPVIFITAMGSTDHKVAGLKMGAEDYITKPFRIQIAMEKIQAVLRRCGRRKEESCYSCGNLEINFDKRMIRKSGELLSLTPTEFDLLQFFCKNRRKILTKDILLENIWDNRRRFVSEHTLSLNISRLRNKIADDQFDYIKTIYGMGYRWIGAEGKE